MSLRNQRGQATTEMAIFGSLILVCFAVLLSYGQSLSEQQTLQQQAFRMALRKAYEDNGFISYNILKHPRVVNLFGGYGEGSRGGTSAGASVLWTKGDIENFEYYQVNEDLITPDDLQGKEIWNVETEAQTEYILRETKSETPSGITTSKQAGLEDTVVTTLKVEGGDDIIIRQGLDSDGRYRKSAADTTVSRSRTWKTPH